MAAFDVDEINDQWFLRFSGGEEAEFLHSDVAAALKPKWYVLGTRGALVADWRHTVIQSREWTGDLREELGRDRRSEKDCDTREEPHAREAQPKGRRLRGEPFQLSLSGAVIEGFPDAQSDVRAGARPGYIPDPRVGQLSPGAPDGGCGRGVERELDGVRHRHGS